MKEYIGGNLFVPLHSGPDLATLIKLAVDVLSDAGTIYAISIQDQGEWRDLPQVSPNALSALEQTDQSALFMPIAGLEGACYFLGSVESDYLIVGIEVYEDDVASPGDISAVNTFVKRWVSFCEQAGVIYGSFCKYGNATTWEECQKRLQALQQADISQLFVEFSLDWLVYLAAPLAKEGQQEALRISEEEAIDVHDPSFTLLTLPSDALFIRTSHFAKQNLYA